MDKPVPLFVPVCSTNVPSNVPTMEQAETQSYQGLEVVLETFVPFVPRFYTPLLVFMWFIGVLVLSVRLFVFNSGGKNDGTNGTEFKKTLSIPYIPTLTACSKKGTKTGTTMEHCSIESGTTDGTIKEHSHTGVTDCSKNRSISFRNVPHGMEHPKRRHSNGYSHVFIGCSICSMIFNPTVRKRVKN